MKAEELIKQLAVQEKRKIDESYIVLDRPVRGRNAECLIL